MLCDKVYRLRVDGGQVSPAYLEVILNSPRVLDEIERIKSGISDSGLNLTQSKFSALVVPLPPLTEQERIESMVAKSFSISEVAEQDCRRSQDWVGRLRQSILKWAFKGRLVDQDPTDEPASVLLERIRAEREAKPAQPKRTRRRAAATKRAHA
jgi:type I restriction enzyme S subunit